MSLYVVLHHPRDPEQPWANSWIDDDRIAAITTTTEIGRFCLEAKQRSQQVLVHRCAYGSTGASVSCSVDVQAVHQIGGGAYVVFQNPKVLGTPTLHSPPRGTNSYYA
jgi:hypothetical protein